MTRAHALGVAAMLSLAASLVAACGPGPLPAFPPEPAAEATVSFDDFAGADACAACHREQYDAWTASTHGRAGGAPAAGLLVRAFDGRPIRFRDASVVPTLDGRGRHVFVVRQDDRPERTLVVDGVVGGAHMVGGGTQGFVTRWADGTVRFLPFELIRRGQTWFCNTSTRLNRGWLPITPELRLADCGDWTPVRVLGGMASFANCQECHGSQIDVVESTGRPHETRYRSLRIDCESCHGPAARHAAATADSTARDAPIPASLSIVTKDESVQLCFRCHALKDALRPGYLPGMPLGEYYSTGLALLSDEPVFADGRIRTFAYQQGHLWSDCYLSGSMTCTDCHAPHRQDYRDANGAPLPGRFADGQCTACHASKAERIEAHTHHRDDSPGSRCVACHMPYLQEPDVGNAIPYARSDHTIPLPRPAFDARLGVEVACALCHADRDATTLEADARAWWGELKPHHPLVAGLANPTVRASRDSIVALLARVAALTDTAARPPARHRAAEVLALGTLFRDHLAPDSEPPAALLDRMRAAAHDTDPDIAALGLAALHFARGDNRTTRRFLVQRLAGLEPAADRAIRGRWIVLLGFLGDRAREAGQHVRATIAYRKALQLRPEDDAVLTSLAITLATIGDTTAESTFQQAIRADSTNALAWLNLGLLRAARGDEGAALLAYQRALRADSTNAIAWFNVGNVHLRARRFEEALAFYSRALDYAPHLANAHFNRARAHIALGRLDEARTDLRNGLDFEPGDRSARDALAQLESQR